MTQFGRPYFMQAMQRATPGILTLPSSSQVLTLAMTALAIRSRAGPPAQDRCELAVVGGVVDDMRGTERAHQPGVPVLHTAVTSAPRASGSFS